MAKKKTSNGNGNGKKAHANGSALRRGGVALSPPSNRARTPLKSLKKKSAAPAPAPAKETKEKVVRRIPIAKVTKKKIRVRPPVVVVKPAPVVIPKPVPPPVVPEVEAVPSTYIDRGLPIPMDYGYDRLVALVRDPIWIFSYWELHGARMPSLRSERGQEFIDSCAWVMRLYRLNEGVAIDMEVDPGIGNWYINVGGPGRYQLELGLLSPEGEWISLLVSQVIETPLNGPSDVIDDEWGMRPEDEEALMALLRRQLPMEDAAKRGTSGFLGASRLQSSFGLVSSMQLLGSSASGRPVAGSWAFSMLGASRVAGSGSGSGGFGWLVAPGGAHEPQLERPMNFSSGGNGGPNWNAQSDLPSTGAGRTAQPHFKVKLPRRLKGLTPPPPSWPPAPRPKTALKRKPAAQR